MSSPPRTDTSPLPSSETFRTVVEWLSGSVTRISFWTAVTLPFLYLPLLATGLETTTTTGAFLALLALNVLALVVGHRHPE